MSAPANATVSSSINVAYTACEVAVAASAVVGNLLVLLAFRRERRLRRRTNYYIVSLATADLLVGLLGIPCALLASVGLPAHKHACLFTVSLLVVLCTISIFCLVAVSVDRYWAILHPMGYSRNVRTKTAIGIICACWAAGSTVGLLPLMGWNRARGDDIASCYFEDVMAPQFLVFLYVATIIAPALLMAAFYLHIYTVVLKQLKQMVTVNGAGGCGTQGSMLRVLGAARKREVKATQNLSIIVGFFMVCWIPLYTINFIQAYYPPWHAPSTVTLCCIILSHLNSAGNPLLYAYHLRDFRAALRSLLCGPPPEKSAGRENVAFQETPTEHRERMKRVNSASTLYYPPAGDEGALVRGHRRSMTVPLYQPEPPPLYRMAGEQRLIAGRILELDLSCIMENSQSQSQSDEARVLRGATTTDTTELDTDQRQRSDRPDSPLSYVDERPHEVYGLGPIVDQQDLGVRPEHVLTTRPDRPAIEGDT